MRDRNENVARARADEERPPAEDLERAGIWIRREKVPGVEGRSMKWIARGCWQGGTGPDNVCSDWDC